MYESPGSCKWCNNQGAHKRWDAFWAHVIRFHYEELGDKPLGEYSAKKSTAASCMEQMKKRWGRLISEQQKKMSLPSKYCHANLAGSRVKFLYCDSKKKNKKKR